MQAQANCRVGVAALNTLAGYIDWVPMSHITAENCKLLEVLCLLLNEQELQLGAAECLLIAVSRKVSYRFRLTWILSLWGMPVCVPFHVWWKTFKGLGVFFCFVCFTWLQPFGQQFAGIPGIHWQDIQRCVGLGGSWNICGFWCFAFKKLYKWHVKTHIVLCQRIVEGDWTDFIADLANKWDHDFSPWRMFLDVICFHIIIITQHI